MNTYATLNREMRECRETVPAPRATTIFAPFARFAVTVEADGTRWRECRLTRGA